MRYKLLGHTGLRVSELALGTMTFLDGSLRRLGTDSIDLLLPMRIHDHIDDHRHTVV